MTTPTDSDRESIEQMRGQLANAFGKELDPLQQYESTLKQIDVDVFDLFVEKRLTGINDRTENSYERVIRHWKEYMESCDRHPACPTDIHVQSFTSHLETERGNGDKTIRGKLRTLNRVYKYWTNEAALPHNTDFNPFQSALDEFDVDGTTKKPHPISVSELAELVRGVKHIRDRAIMVVQPKWGTRATETCNIELQDLSLPNQDVQEHYPELGTNPWLEGRDNAIYIPHDREGNKSRNPRILPLDDETRRVLTQYLLIRPDNGEPYLFLSKSSHSHMHRNGISNVWEKYLPEKYLKETEQYRAIKSHYGRHWFTNYWKVNENLNREHIKYMRGDVTSDESVEEGAAIDDYINPNYDDIEEPYRKRIFKLGI